MNPYKLKDVFNYLTSNNQLLKRKLKLGTDDIPIPPKRDDVTTIEAINRFNKANPRVDTTNLKPLSVKHSKVKQSNVGEADEGTIQSAFDTATREAQFEGYPAPNYDKFKSRYLKKNMKADGGRIGYKDGPKLTDFFDVKASGSKTGKQQIQGAPEGITSDKEIINAIITMDIPLTEKVNLIGDLQYGKFRDRIEYKDDEIFLDDPKSYRNRNIGLDYNRGGEGFSGSATVGDEGPEFNIRYKKSFADGGMLVQSSDDGSRPGYKEDKKNIYPREKGTDKYKLSEAYKKSITPKGYVDVQELIDLIDNPKLTQNLFTQARKFEKNPKKYPGRKNYVYNKIKSLLGEKKVSQGGSSSPYATKIFYKKPSKQQIDTLTNFIDSRILETGTVKNLEILHKEFGKLFEGKQTKGFFTNTLTLDKARDVFLKKHGIKPTDSQLARAMMRLGQVYNGQLFQNDINISKNKRAGNFIDKSFNEIDMFNDWKGASYDAALDDISKNMPKKAGDIRNFKTTLNNYIKQNYPKVFKKYDVNEIFSVTTSSVRGSYPYSYFVDLTKSDVNQKLLANFQGQASKAEGQIQKAIANYRRTGNVKFYEEALSVANKFNTVNREKFLSNERVIKAGGVNAVKLEIGSQQQIKDKIGFANEYYKQNNLDKWKSQGIDIDAHTGKSGYVKTLGTKTVPKGVSTFTDLVQDGEVNEKEVKKILQNIQGYSKLPQCKVGVADGGRIGFAYSDECIRDGLKEQKIEAQKGNKKAAQELVQVGKVATRAGLLKNLLGPGAILGEAVYEGAVIGNKVLGGTPKDIAWAESYLSYLDPRKYTPEGLDPLKMKREDMITREDFNDPDYAEGESKTIDGPNANILRSGFAAQDQVSAFNEAVNERERAKKAGRLDQYNPAAADVREQGRFVDQSKDIISSDAFQEATKQAQEYIANQEAQNRFNLGIFGTPQGELSDDRRRYEANKAMLEKFPIYTPEIIDSMYKKANIEKPENLDYADFAKQMSDYDKSSYFADNFRTEKAGGGLLKQAGDRSGAMTRSMNPDSQGLSYLFNRVKKV